MKKIVAVCIVLFSFVMVFAQEHDLTINIWYFRKGFDISWINVVPAPTDEAWCKVEYPRGKRTMLIREIPIPGKTSKSSWNPIPAKPETYTVLVPFVARQDVLELADPALYLRFIGQAWAVYLNGTLIHNAIIKAGTDSFITRAERNVIIAIDRKLLNDGANMLALEIIGDPGDNKTGFALRGPYKIASYQKLVKENLDVLDLIMIAIYAIFGLYNIVLFILRTKDKGYLFLGTATIILSVYLLTRTSLLFSVFTNTVLIAKLEYFSMLGVPIFFFGFFELLLQNKLSKRWFVIFYSTLAFLAAGLFLRDEPFIAVWRVLIVIVGFYYVVFVVGKTVGKDILRLANELAEEGIGGFAGAFKWFFLESDTGKIMAGTIIFLITIILDTIRAINGELIFWAKYGFAFFLLGAASLLASKFISIYNEMEQLKIGLNKLVEERTHALAKTTEELTRLNKKIEESSEELKIAMKEAEHDLRLASSVQKGFFIGKAPELDDWDIALRYLSAQSLSGDFYDFYQSEKQLKGLIIGSVSGRSVASGLLTVLTRHIGFRVFNETLAKPMGQYVYNFNKALVREFSSVENFVLCNMVRIKPDAFEYVNGGMPDLLMMRNTEIRTIVPEDSSEFKLPPMGRNQIEHEIKVLEVPITSGDILVLCTEGLIASKNNKNETFGIEKLKDSLKKADKESAETIMLSIIADYRNFITQKRQPYDITLIVLRKR
ncbi:MAG TPA: SpoIIE family protein phosphatase [Spirochaetia bacterium]|nr:SpoIIE family protein phosphatase [Spirochaetia bacterium]